jgi:simple sugar transport system ATP-binding protein
MIDPAHDRTPTHTRAALDGPPALVEAIGIRKRFGPTIALDDAGLAIPSGAAHGLVGRNGAGKSTLVSILTGLQAPDAGEVRFNGAAAPPLGNRDAWRRQVACVYQHSTVIPSLTVAENLFLNRQSRGRLGAIGWRRLRDRARSLLHEWSVDVDPGRLAADLTVEQRQLLEIARALSFGARFIILDEPTAQLDGRAIERLFGRLRSLQASGVAFLFISHHLQEIYEICQFVTVFRDGRNILTRPVGEVSPSRLVDAMTGDAREAVETTRARGTPTPAARTVLSIRGLSLDGSFQDVSVEVGAGEVVAVAGAGGSGKVELAETVVGLRKATSGEVRVGDRPLRPRSVAESLRCGVGFVPQDRRREGLVPLLSVADNITLAVGPQLGRAGLIEPGRRRTIARRMLDDLDIKAHDITETVANFSGGNQQKVVMARALASNPRVLVLVTPTAGVDVRARESLLATVDRAAGDGAAVLLVSDDLDELRRADRVLVLFRGRMVREHSGAWSDRDLVAAMEGVDGSGD